MVVDEGNAAEKITYATAKGYPKDHPDEVTNRKVAETIVHHSRNGRDEGANEGDKAPESNGPEAVLVEVLLCLQHPGAVEVLLQPVPTGQAVADEVVD